MARPRMRRRAGWAVLVALVAPLALAAPVSVDENPPVLVRPKYEPGRMLRYRLRLSGATAWTPAPRGVDWGKMTTDFTGVLNTKVIRDSGACTFDLIGEKLQAVGEGPNGKIQVEATRQKARIRIGDKIVTDADKSPLAKPMTMTFGSRGAYLYGTGLAPLAIYTLPHVDRRFWLLLTVAPPQKVAPGDNWEVAFDFAVPGGKGKPLNVKAKWNALGWQTYRRQKVLAMTLAADLNLKDSYMLLKNGDRVHVHSGTYKASGKVLWDVEHGQLCSAEARQKILIKVDKPTPRALRSECSSSLKLLAAKTVTPKK